MREMKDSGAEWIGEIPQNWSAIRFKYLTRCETMRSDNNDNYIGLENVESWTGKILPNQNEAFEAEGGSVSIKKGDILFGKLRPYLAKCCIAEKDGCCSTEFLVLRETDLVASYIKYIMTSPTFINDVNMSTYGAKMPRATWNYIGNMQVPYPSETEQKKIVDYLDSKCSKIDSIIEKQQAIIEKLKEYKLSIITETVTKGLNVDAEMKDSGIKWIRDMPSHWQRARLSDVTDRIIVGLATSVTPYYRPSGMVLLRNLNIKEGYLDDTELLYLDKEFADSQTGKYIEKDDVLTVHTGSNLGLTCVVPDIYEHTLSFTTLITTPNKEKIDSFYLMYTINSGLGKSEIDKLKCGDIKPNLNVGQFKYFTVFVPPISEQQAIVSFLNKKTKEIDNDISVKEQVILKLNEYKKSLIYEVVTGKKEV